MTVIILHNISSRHFYFHIVALWRLAVSVELLKIADDKLKVRRKFLHRLGSI